MSKIPDQFQYIGKMLYQWEMTYFNMLRLEDRTLDAYSQIDTALQVMLYKDVDDKFDERQAVVDYTLITSARGIL